MDSSGSKLGGYLLLRRANSEYVCMHVCILEAHKHACMFEIAKRVCMFDTCEHACMSGVSKHVCMSPSMLVWMYV